MKKLYAKTRFGLIHARMIGPNGDENSPVLLCLHPAPSSGLYFTTAMPLLNNGRRVIAPDYPGYGGSDSMPEPPSIQDYATAMLEFVGDIGLDRPFDVLGFHTGCLVGSEMALQQPASIRRLVLCDVPYFDAAARPALREKMAQPLAITSELSSLEPAWTFNVASRIDNVPMPRTVELLAEHLRVGANDYFGFHAAFSYACEERLPRLASETIVIATQSMLRDASLSAAAAIPDAKLVEASEISTAVFESGAAAICERINSALS